MLWLSCGIGADGECVWGLEHDGVCAVTQFGSSSVLGTKESGADVARSVSAIKASLSAGGGGSRETLSLLNVARSMARDFCVARVLFPVSHQ